MKAPCTAGILITENNLQIAYTNLVHDESEILSCPSGYEGLVTVLCQFGTATYDLALEKIALAPHSFYTIEETQHYVG